MSESDAVTKTNRLNTKDSLAEDFRRLGLGPGSAVIVHSSLSSIGWVCGGAVSVVQALMEVITPDGTIVMPAHSSDLSDPSGWGNPPVPAEWWDEIKRSMPAFDPKITPTRGMGKIADVFRTFPDVVRSGHPSVSFAAWGKHARFVTDDHSLEFGLGELSPLARVYDLDGDVLLLGVDYNRNTSFHLAEHRVSAKTFERQGAPIFENGERVWKTYDDIELDSDPFTGIGKEFEEKLGVTTGRVGASMAKRFKMRQAVDFAKAWLEEHRTTRSG